MTLTCGLCLSHFSFNLLFVKSCLGPASLFNIFFKYSYDDFNDFIGREDINIKKKEKKNTIPLFEKK